MFNTTSLNDVPYNLVQKCGVFGVKSTGFQIRFLDWISIVWNPFQETLDGFRHIIYLSLSLWRTSDLRLFRADNF